MSFRDEVNEILRKYEEEFEIRYESAQKEIHSLEEELKREADISVKDYELRERLDRLENAPYDTWLREAGVVLESRIRQLIAPDGNELHGVQLVDSAFNTKNGKLKVSEHEGEQEGIRMLYRGAIQFIRNPPMHKLIEYPDTLANTSISIIDALLILLDEVSSKKQTKEKGRQIRWTIEKLHQRYERMESKIGVKRFMEILQWAEVHKIYALSVGVFPAFGVIGQVRRRVVNFYDDGSMYFYLMLDRYNDDAQRQEAFIFYQKIGLIERHIELSNVHDGKWSRRRLHELSDDEFTELKQLLTQITGK